jgi:hypothetical protein
MKWPPDRSPRSCPGPHGGRVDRRHAAPPACSPFLDDAKYLESCPRPFTAWRAALTASCPSATKLLRLETIEELIIVLILAAVCGERGSTTHRQTQIANCGQPRLLAVMVGLAVGLIMCSVRPADSVRPTVSFLP